MAERTCTLPNCDTTIGRHGARGMCPLHYFRWWRNGDPQPELPAQRASVATVCEVADCGKDRYSNSRMCVTHHMRRWRYGDPLVDKQHRKGACKIDGCGKPHSSLGWCTQHYTRWVRHGDPLVTHPNARYSDRRYRRIKRPSHPLACRDGTVALHRFVLYEAIGPGAHPCQWCSMLVAWEKSYPQDPDALVVDHLDWNRANNALTNLVPSCSPCNTGRQGCAS
jgi:hypothetical protein